MPNVTAPTRTMNNGEAITYFTDTVGTSSVTWTYQNEQEGLTVTNKGVSNLTLTVNGVNYTINPGGVQTVSAVFTAFTIVSASGTQQFDAHAWSFQKDTVIAQLSGRNVVKIKEVSAITGLTTAAGRYVGANGEATSTAVIPFDVSVYKDLSMFIHNKHDVSITAAIRFHYGLATGYDTNFMAATAYVTVAAGAKYLLTVKDDAILNGSFVGVVMHLTRTTAPTLGDVDLKLLGRPY